LEWAVEKDDSAWDCEQRVANCLQFNEFTNALEALSGGPLLLIASSGPAEWERH
jgi:hypothetical protein